MSELSKAPYKGTRDFYPEDKFIQNYIFSVWTDVCRLYGFEEYTSSLLEETALYAAKTGQEIVNEQTYSFVDRGERQVTIRPEMTPTFARMIAARRMELPYPVRWFSIPNLFRYEKPQRGRLREHWQLNVDIAGASSLYAEAELMKLSFDIMKRFGASMQDMVMKVNSRKLLHMLFDEVLQLDETKKYSLSKLIDKMHKISAEDFRTACLELMTPAQLDILQKFVGATTIEEIREVVGETLYSNNEGVREILEVKRILGSEYAQSLQFDPTLMRGFDYYTGLIFELFDTHPANPRAMFGGGRYDDLVGIFGVDPITCVGFGMGDVVIQDFLETHGLLPQFETSAEVYVAVLHQDCLEYAQQVVTALRKKEIGAAMEMDVRKMDKQMKSIDKMHIPYAVIIGENEVKNGELVLKEMATGNEFRGKLEDIIQHILR